MKNLIHDKYQILNLIRIFGSMNYEKHYDHLMERAKARSLDIYTEKHHIIPKSIGGTNEKNNLVRLTPEEHYLAHLLLVKMTRYKNDPRYYKLIYAANIMTIGIGRNNKAYGWVKRQLAETKSQIFAGRKQSPEHIAKRVAKLHGQVRSAEVKERCRIAKLGKKRKPFSSDHIEKIRSANFGKVHSTEAKEKIRQAHLGKPKPMRPDHMKMLADLAKGRKDTEETKRRRSESAKAGWMKRNQKGLVHPNQGKHLSEETKQKISKAHTKRNREKTNGE
jgi:hypothetical protein